MNKALKYKLVITVVVLFLLILLPQGLNAPSQIQTTSIATAVGVDKSEKGIEISVQVLVPKPSSNYSPNYLIASAQGKNVPEAIENAQLKLGQELGLAHCFVIILGNEVCNENLADVLDFFMRSNIMGNNAVLLHTDKTAKELLKASSKLSESDVNNLQNIAKFNQEHNSSSNTNLISFFNSYLSPCPFSVIATVSVDDKNEEKSQGKEQSGQEQSGQSGEQSSSQAKVLKNEGKAIVVKKGKKALELEKEDLQNFEWLDPRAKEGFLVLEHINSNVFKDARVTLHITKKTINFDAKVNNNKPILNAHVFFESVIDSIEQNDQIESVHENFCTDDFKQQIEQEVKSQIFKALKLMKENNLDIADFYTIFNTQDTKNWKNYLKTLDNPQNYMQDIEVVSTISVHNKL